MQDLTTEGRAIVEEVARRNGVSTEAVLVLLRALVAGGGSQAQFNHPDLGGMGQWSRGGMTMVGDMFNNGLKYRVDALCTELSGLLGGTALFAPSGAGFQGGGYSQSGYQSQSQGNGGVSFFVPGSGGGARWPAELGQPSSSGSQNDLHYAVFPGTRRLAIERSGQVTVYDTGDHQIGGFSQQQGGDQSISFTSQYGLIRVADLPVVGAEAEAPGNAPRESVHAPHVEPDFEPWVAPVAPPPAASSVAGAEEDIFAKIERLADLHGKGILTQAEFEAKKSDLLGRL